jgi:hypothetical protein
MQPQAPKFKGGLDITKENWDEYNHLRVKNIKTKHKYSLEHFTTYA